MRLHLSFLSIRKTIISILVGILSMGTTGARAEEDGQAKAALIELASEKRAAALKLTLDYGAGRTGSLYGAFISADGLALVAMEAVTTTEEPKVTTADGKSLEFGKILKLLPEQGLAVMKFDHAPKSFVPLAADDPEIGENIALIPLNRDASGFGTVPAVLGPVMMKRTMPSSNLKRHRFIRSMSLGSGLSMEQRKALGAGCFAIDREGKLVAFVLGLADQSRQTLLLLHPVTGMDLATEGKVLEHPLSDADNPIDPVMIDTAYSKMLEARGRRDVDATRSIYRLLLKRHPNSSILNLSAASSPILSDIGEPMLSLDDFPYPDSESLDKVQQYIRHGIRIGILLGSKELEQMDKGELDDIFKETKAAIRCSPKDCPELRAQLADIYMELGRDQEAWELLREIYPYMSDSIEFVERFEALLGRLGKDDPKVTDRIYELENLYRQR